MHKPAWLGPAVMVLLLALAIGLLLVGRVLQQQGLQDYQQQRSRLEQAAGSYRRRLEDQRLYGTYGERFEGYRQRGIMRGEVRLDVIEGLEAGQQQLQLLNFQYSLSRRNHLSASPLHPKDEGIALYGSVLEVAFLARHEDELLAFLHHLRGVLPGLLGINSCRLAMPRAAGLDAACHFSLYSLQQVAGP